jgi:hypothetical protein
LERRHALRLDPFRGILAPARLSLSAMATTCLRLRTLVPDELRTGPRRYSPITLPTLASARPVFLLEGVAISASSLAGGRQTVRPFHPGNANFDVPARAELDEKRIPSLAPIVHRAQGLAFFAKDRWHAGHLSG